MKTKLDELSFFLVCVVSVGQAAITNVTCPTINKPPLEDDVISVTWESETDVERNASAVFFFDENDPSCHTPLAGPTGAIDIEFFGAQTINCTEKSFNVYIFYVMEIYGESEIITEEDVLYKVSCIYGFRQNVTAQITILGDPNEWNVTGPPAVETTEAVANEAAFLHIIEVGDVSPLVVGDTEVDITDGETEVGSTIYLRTNVTINNFAGFKVVDVWAFYEGCTSPGNCNAPEYATFQLYEEECPASQASQINLEGPVAEGAGDLTWMVKVTDNFTAFRFSEPTAEGGTAMVFIVEIYLCQWANDTDCLQDSCSVRRKRGAWWTGGPTLFLEAPVRVVDKKGSPLTPTILPENLPGCAADFAPYYIAIAFLLLALFVSIMIIGYLCNRVRIREEEGEEDEVDTNFYNDDRDSLPYVEEKSYIGSVI